MIKGSIKPDSSSAPESTYTAFMKGAPEVLLKYCSRYLRNGEVYNINDEFNAGAMEAYPYFARRGQRVLGFCMREFQFESVAELTVKDVPLNQMTFVGMLAIMDPPRADVPDAIVKCRKAGIKGICLKLF